MLYEDWKISEKVCEAKLFSLYLSDFRKAGFLRTREQRYVLVLFRWHYNKNGRVTLLVVPAKGLNMSHSMTEICGTPEEDRTALGATNKQTDMIWGNSICLCQILKILLISSSLSLLNDCWSDYMSMKTDSLSFALRRLLTFEMNAVAVLFCSETQVAFKKKKKEGKIAPILIHLTHPCKNFSVLILIVIQNLSVIISEK